MHNWLVGHKLISQLPKIVGSEESKAHVKKVIFRPWKKETKNSSLSNQFLNFVLDVYLTGRIICISSSASLSNTVLTIWQIWSCHSGCVFASLSLVFSFLISTLFFSSKTELMHMWTTLFEIYLVWVGLGLGCLNRGRQIWESIFREWETVHARIWESSAISLVTTKSWHGPSIGFSLVQGPKPLWQFLE